MIGCPEYEGKVYRGHDELATVCFRVRVGMLQMQAFLRMYVSGVNASWGIFLGICICLPIEVKYTGGWDTGIGVKKWVYGHVLRYIEMDSVPAPYP